MHIQKVDMKGLRIYCIALIMSGFSTIAFAQHGQGEHGGQQHGAHAQEQGQHAGEPEKHDAPAAGQAHGDTAAHDSACGHSVNDETPFNAGELAVHHIADNNALHIFGDTYLHLPCFLYAPGHGWTATTTAAFESEHHGNGTRSVNGYALVHGNVMRLQDERLADGNYPITDYTHKEEEVNGKAKPRYFAMINGQCAALEPKSTLDGGVMGGGLTNFYDFSITRNVFTMLMTVLLLFFVFRSVALSYTKRAGQAPKGLQNFFEPFITFIRDDVAKPNIGKNYERYMPYLLSAFFFILGLNLVGQIPFFPGGANVTGNISVTIVLAIITFLITSLSANKEYWRHIFAMPGVPKALLVILTPVEILGAILKPFTLLLRLFANITAGHIVIISFVSLIFIFTNKFGAGVGTGIGIAASVPLTLFMMALELLVAFLQAFIFTMLSATYIGTAIEEHHH